MDAVNRQRSVYTSSRPLDHSNDSSPRSGLHSLINRDHYYPTSNMANERDHQQPHTSVAPPSATSPTSMYPSHPPPPYSQTNPAPPLAHSLLSLMSTSQPNAIDSRRMSGDVKDSVPQRLSLPSIHEALLSPNTLAASRNNVDQSHTRPYGSFPQPPPTPTSRANSIDGAAYQPQTGLPQRNSPPHPIHPSSYPKPDHMPPSPFDNPRYPPLPSIRTALPSQPSAHSGPSPEFLKPEKDLRTIAPVSVGYPQQSPQHSHHPGQQNSSNSAPTSAYSPQSPYQQRPYRSRYEYGEEHAKAAENPVTQKAYGPVVKRHLDYWDIEIELNNMRTCGNEITRISSMLLQDAQQNTHHGSMPERMPSLNNIDLIRIQQERLSAALQRVADRVVSQGQGPYQGEQNGPTQGGKPAEEYSQEELNWDDGRNIGGYGGPDAKKRRGRAAPPGRCHSCNRAETPEWRRGPDGARTLCNACGLHYAKLTRKLGSKQAQNGGSSLRPNSIGEVSPRS